MPKHNCNLGDAEKASTISKTNSNRAATACVILPPAAPWPTSSLCSTAGGISTCAFLRRRTPSRGHPHPADADGRSRLSGQKRRPADRQSQHPPRKRRTHCPSFYPDQQRVASNLPHHGAMARGSRLDPLLTRLLRRCLGGKWPPDLPAEAELLLNG
jgi:hypothetical protein